MALYIHEAGPTGAPAIVFLHGLGLSGKMWQPQLERLPEFHCLAPDLPEHARSAQIGPFTLNGAAQQIVEVIRSHTPNGRAHVVGLSLGGAVAMALLNVAPEVVDHVIVSGTSTRLGPILAALNRLNEPIIRLLKPNQLASLMFRQFGIPSQYHILLDEDMYTFTAEAFTHANQELTTVNLPREVQTPMLVVVGQKETIVARQMAKTIVHTISGAKGVIAPGVGHVWNLQAPDLFGSTVRAWVTDQPLPAELVPLLTE